MTIDHVLLNVHEDKFKEALQIYLEALKPLGYELRHQYGDFVVGLGSTNDAVPDKPAPADFWLVGRKDMGDTKTHIGFSTLDRGAVDAFHAAALKAGAKDNGAPGVRTMYHPNYYAAFFVDPVGNCLEAVCHKPE